MANEIPAWDETDSIPAWHETEEIKPQKKIPQDNGNPIFRSASRIEGNGLGATAGKGVLGLIDLLNTPMAAAAKLRGQNMGDEDPYFFKPEVEAMKTDTSGEGAETTKDLERINQSSSIGIKEHNIPFAYPDYSWQTKPSAVNANIEAVGHAVSDPLSYIGMLPKILSGAGGSIKNKGGKIAESVIKPLDQAQAEGFDIHNFFKNDLAGTSLRTSKWMTQSRNNLAELRKSQGSELNQALNASGRDVSGTEALQSAQDEIQKLVHSGEMDPSGAERAYNTYAGRIGAVSEDGLIPVDVANRVKRRAQMDAEALYKARNLGTDPHATEKAVFAEALARKLRGDLEHEVPGVIEPNRILSETKPFVRSLKKADARIAKNDGFGLKDATILSGIGATAGHGAGGGAGAFLGALPPWMLFAVNKASQNPGLGSLLYRTGHALEKAGDFTGKILGRDLFPGEAQIADPENINPALADELSRIKSPFLSYEGELPPRSPHMRPALDKPITELQRPTASSPFGEPSASLEFDPLQTMDPRIRNPLNEIQNGRPGLEGMFIPDNLKSEVALDAYARQGRDVRIPKTSESPGGVQIISPDDAGLRPRTPKISGAPNFPQPYIESPAFQNVIEGNPGRFLLDMHKKQAITKALESAKGMDRRQLLNDLAALNWKKPE